MVRGVAAVEFEQLEEGIALITLNRPERLNAIDGALLTGVEQALDEIGDPGRYRAAILTGAGRGFCSGADLSGTGEPWTPPARTELKTNYDAQVRITGMYTRLYECPVP